MGTYSITRQKKITAHHLWDYPRKSSLVFWSCRKWTWLLNDKKKHRKNMYYLSQISAFSPAFTVSHIWKFLQPPEKLVTFCQPWSDWWTWVRLWLRDSSNVHDFDLRGILRLTIWFCLKIGCTLGYYNLPHFQTAIKSILKRTTNSLKANDYFPLYTPSASGHL